MAAIAGDEGQEQARSLGLVWARPKVDGLGPSARGGHTAVSADHYMIIFGGQFYSGSDSFTYCNDVHVLDLESMKWHEPKCSGDVPSGRYGHSAAMVGSRMFVFGGRIAGGDLPKDVHYLDTTTWEWHRVQLSTAAPPGRLCHASTLVGTKVVVFGGWDGRRSMDDLWVFDTDTMGWIKPRTSGPQPSPRQGASIDILPDGRLVVFGGCTVTPGAPPRYWADVRELDTETMVWSRGSVSGEYPAARYWHKTCVVGSTALCFGGWAGTDKDKLIQLPRFIKPDPHDDGTTRVGYLVALEGMDMQWEHPPSSGRVPALRYGHSLARVGNHIYVWGGWDGNRALRDLAELVLVDEEYEARVREGGVRE